MVGLLTGPGLLQSPVPGSSWSYGPSPEPVFPPQPWLGSLPANDLSSARMPGKLLFTIFSEIKGVMLGSQDPLSQTNKQASSCGALFRHDL